MGVVVGWKWFDKFELLIWSSHLWSGGEVTPGQTDRGKVSILSRDEDHHPDPVSSVHLGTGGEVGQDERGSASGSSELRGRREERELGQ